MNALSYALDVLFPPRDTDLVVREITPELLAEKIDPRMIGDVTALFPYRDPIVHALIVEAKFHGNKRARMLLGGALAEYLLEHSYEENAIEKRPIALVPLPLSGKRKRSRGYNQVEEILKAANVVVVPAVLSRVRDTVPQTKLQRTEREENVRDAFAAHNPDPRYLYMVVDDVVTTGATLAEAVQALKREGATARAIALAY